MNDHQKTMGKRSTPVFFLTHQMNHSRKSNRLVISLVVELLSERYCNGLQSVSEIPLVLETT